MTYMKVSIEHSVPMNNGDAALIFALGEALGNYGLDITYTTFNLDFAQENYGRHKWSQSILSSKITKLPFIGYLVLFFYVLLSSYYKNLDGVIASPGGYLHGYYKGTKRKLQLLVLVKRIHKRTICMYSQSVGELSQSETAYLKRNLSHFDLFYVRDQISYRRLQALNVNDLDNVRLTADAAFLLESLPRKESAAGIAFSVRSWSRGNRDKSKYYNLVFKLVGECIRLGFDVTFLSTCQGISGYTNDASVAEEIYHSMPAAWQKRVFIDKEYNTLDQLRSKLAGFKYVIGTRLHMCILAWLSNTPALNISYEEKGVECYQYLQIPMYSIDYNHDGDIAPLLQQFLADDHEHVFQTIEDLRKKSLDHVLELIEAISNNQAHSTKKNSQ